MAGSGLHLHVPCFTNGISLLHMTSNAQVASVRGTITVQLCLFLGGEALLQCSAAVQLLSLCTRVAADVLLGRLSTLDHKLQLVVGCQSQP